MIIIKSQREVELMRSAGEIVVEVLETLKEIMKPGMTTAELDVRAESILRKREARAGFKGYHGFPASTCISVNEQVVHGIPGKYIIKDGDIISIDFGVIYQGLYADAALTVPVGTVAPEFVKLIAVTEKALQSGLSMITPGKRIGDVSYAIQRTVEENGFSVVRDYAGHGIGRQLHEEPQIPNFGKPGTGSRLRAGMTLAVEPMVNAGGYEVKVLEDHWTVVTADNTRSAHCEHTVLVTENGPEILTPWKWVTKE